jgi:hypothetical protein
MSRDPSGEHAVTPPFEQEPESFNGRKVVLTGIVTLVIFTLASIWAMHIWRTEERINAPAGFKVPKEMGQAEIGVVDQIPFEQVKEPGALRARTLERLRSYGWVDRRRGVVHIPVERAFDLVQPELQKGRGK